ncbi:MAG: hypothetical protein J6Y28_01255 [Acholeplasmatales bacterium]|nr:hypothetical protein [Acholeplasmatales bacterium]
MEKKLTIEPKKYKGETNVVSMRLPIELIKEVDRIAKETGRTRNEVLILCLEFSLENIEIKP